MFKHWTLNTSQHHQQQRVGIVFMEFNLSKSDEYIEVGDGLIIGENTRLAHFTGNYIPDDVTSISSAAWISARLSCLNSGAFNITITAINDTGNPP